MPLWVLRADIILIDLTITTTFNALQKWKGVKYTDVAPANSVPLPKKVEQSDLRSVLGDRQPYYAVSVPAETEWARAAFSAAAPEPVASSSEPAATEIKPEDIALAKARFPLDNKNNTAALLIVR